MLLRLNPIVSKVEPIAKWRYCGVVRLEREGLKVGWSEQKMGPSRWFPEIGMHMNSLLPGEDFLI